MLNNLTSFSKSKTQKEYFLFNSLLKSLNQKIIEENKKIETIVLSLENEVKEYSDYFKELQSEINKLRAKNNLRFNNIHNSEEIEIDFDHNEHENDPFKKDIKKVYRLISSKCHPDKTNNKYLNSLFVEAAEAYSNYNYMLLLEIYSAVIGENSEEINNKNDLSLETKLEILKQEYNNRKEEFDNITNTHGYLIKKLMESEKSKDKYTARKLFLDLLFKQILEFEQLKDELEKNLNGK